MYHNASNCGLPRFGRVGRGRDSRACAAVALVWCRSARLVSVKPVKRAAALMGRVFRTAADIADALGRDGQGEAPGRRSRGCGDRGGALGGPGSLCAGAAGEFSTSPTD
jgi:hypothetical protein